jgi:CheY-like chemotaxis protein
MAALSQFEKLLIVDDHTRTRQWLRSSLAGCAREISECSDGAQAVRMFTTEQPDWVLMDIEMKGMDGLTATRLILKDFPNARIVVVTSHATSRIRDAALAAGAVRLVDKEDLWQLPTILSALEAERPEGRV